MTGPGHTNLAALAVEVSQLRGEEHFGAVEFRKEMLIEPGQKFARARGQFGTGAHQTAEHERKEGRGQPLAHHVGHNEQHVAIRRGQRLVVITADFARAAVKAGQGQAGHGRQLLGEQCPLQVGGNFQVAQVQPRPELLLLHLRAANLEAEEIAEGLNDAHLSRIEGPPAVAAADAEHPQQRVVHTEGASEAAARFPQLAERVLRRQRRTGVEPDIAALRRGLGFDRVRRRGGNFPADHLAAPGLGGGRHQPKLLGRAVAQAQDQPVRLREGEQLIQPAMNELIGNDAALQLSAETENGGQTFVGGGQFLGHQVQRALRLAQFVGRAGWGQGRGLLRGGALLAKDQAVLAAPAQVMRLVGEVLDQEESPARLAVGRWQLGLLGHREAGRVVGHARFGPFGGHQQIHADGQMSGVRPAVFDRVVRRFGQRELPGIRLGRGKARLGKELAGPPAKLGRRDDIAGQFLGASLTEMGGDGGHVSAE